MTNETTETMDLVCARCHRRKTGAPTDVGTTHAQCPCEPPGAWEDAGPHDEMQQNIMAMRM